VYHVIINLIFARANKARRDFRRAAGLGQAIRLVLSKQGMFGDISPFQAKAIRAVIFVWAWTAFDGKICATFAVLRGKPQVLRLLALGALLLC